jgi:glycosyltransferase involved in cell wall biosynthesis
LPSAEVDLPDFPVPPNPGATVIRDVFIIMPAYNAGKTIERVFDRIPEEARDRVRRYVVVDDGSTDDTQAALTRLSSRYPSLVALRHDRNRGYGAAEKTLLDYVRQEGAEVAVLLHSDGQYSPESLPQVLQPFDRGDADMVQGSRMLQAGALKGGMPVYKFFANKALTAVANRALGLAMAEYFSGYMAYHRSALEAIPYRRLADTFQFDMQMLVMAKVKSLRVVEIPIPTIYADEVSHLRPVRYGLEVLSILRDYRRGHYHSL